MAHPHKWQRDASGTYGINASYVACRQQGYAYRVYRREPLGGGREFGIDYPTIARARQAKANFEAHWPGGGYYIRKCALERRTGA